MHNALFIMQSKGSQAVVVPEVDKRPEKGVQFWTGCTWVICGGNGRMSEFNTVVGLMFLAFFSIFSIAWCTAVWAPHPRCHTSPWSCFSTDHLGQDSRTHKHFVVGWELVLFIPWLLLHRCVLWFLPWPVVGIPTRNKGTLEAAGQVRGHPQVLVGVMHISAALSEHRWSSIQGTQWWIWTGC